MIEKGGNAPHNGRKHLPMNPKITADDRYSIVYDADELDTVSAQMFEQSHWHQDGDEAGLGRGNACFISGPFGDAVLKRYFRGGQVARWNRESHLYTGVARSRPFREFHLLGWMVQQQLPVPSPLAALVDRQGWFYRGALITAVLPQTRQFSEIAGQPDPDLKLWSAVGQCIRRFHDAGVLHADLNVNNILLDTTGQVFLVDFDKSRRAPGDEHWKLANLYRLRRSVDKLSQPRAVINAGWTALEAGYKGN